MAEETNSSRENIRICIPLELYYAEELKALISQSYQDLNLTIEWHVLPVNRCVMMVSQGILDADIGRSPVVTTKYPNLVSVPVQLFSADVNLYSLAPPDDPVPDPQTLLSDHRYRVAYPSHLLHVRNMAASHSTLGADSADQMIALLRKGRVDYILISATEAEKMENNGKAMTGLYQIQKAYIRIPGHHILNRKHEGLAAELAKGFRQRLETPD
ncbi:hypothetical protein [Emcibacter nanhaiensis]|uniref:Solute-binding protein family 3/N-terminal domain-containing protein n=1 Tax=Emcibacter nanhaiensis TaxID=1505037 RepID=A0A501PH33_9PROT|nr:hypothetical protein [Emcibacter nanhaiensis]TPD59770.1 hypothetical protein FIV46_09770 [Emcibacter nanhaiensis]